MVIRIYIVDRLTTSFLIAVSQNSFYRGVECCVGPLNFGAIFGDAVTSRSCYFLDALGRFEAVHCIASAVGNGGFDAREVGHDSLRLTFQAFVIDRWTKKSKKELLIVPYG